MHYGPDWNDVLWGTNFFSPYLRLCGRRRPVHDLLQAVGFWTWDERMVAQLVKNHQVNTNFRGEEEEAYFVALQRLLLLEAA